MAHTPGKSPYAAAWQQAEHELLQRIHAVHETGWTVDRSRDHLRWQGHAADRFRSRADSLHRDLHEHNDVLRALLTLVRQAAAEAPKTHQAAS